MRLKIHNGTPLNGDDSLCTSCRHSTIIRGRTLDEEIVHCHAASMRTTRVTFKVTSCSAYSDRRLPSVLELMEHAWILQRGSKRRSAGFIRASDLREEEMATLWGDMYRRGRE